MDLETVHTQPALFRVLPASADDTMPRKTTFAVEDALDAAIDLFTERGYQYTRMADLARRLGMSRSSVYATFGDKQSLFAQTLQRYGTECRAPGMHALRSAGSPRAALLGAFEWAADADASLPRDRQCLLINAALGSGTFAPGVSQALHDMFLGMELRFRNAIARARSANEVAGNVDPVQTARALLGLYLSLYTLVRSGAQEPVLRAVVQYALSLLPVPAAERAERSDQAGR